MNTKYTNYVWHFFHFVSRTLVMSTGLLSWIKPNIEVYNTHLHRQPIHMFGVWREPQKKMDTFTMSTCRCSKTVRHSIWNTPEHTYAYVTDKSCGNIRGGRNVTCEAICWREGVSHWVGRCRYNYTAGQTEPVLCIDISPHHCCTGLIESCKDRLSLSARKTSYGKATCLAER